MTPQEIVDTYKKDWLLQDIDRDKDLMKNIMEFAREMCDKQKQQCIGAWGDSPDPSLEYDSILSAPYPKELNS